MLDPKETIDEESTLGGRINSDLPFEDALKVLLKGDEPEGHAGEDNS
jgi:hypothetical protein